MSSTAEPPLFPLQPGALVCANRHCATVLPAGVEACDECGESRFEPIASIGSLLCGLAGDRSVAFPLSGARAVVIGRDADGSGSPEVDLSRFPSSDRVHRRHARLEIRNGSWYVTHLGTNTLSIVNRSGRASVGAGASQQLRPGDTLEVAGVKLQLVTRSAPRGA
jgi:hypothetical protein